MGTTEYPSIPNHRIISSIAKPHRIYHAAGSGAHNFPAGSIPTKAPGTAIQRYLCVRIYNASLACLASDDLAPSSKYISYEARFGVTIRACVLDF